MITGFAHDIFLKHSGANIGLIHSPEIFSMIEKGIRGGLWSESSLIDFIKN